MTTHPIDGRTYEALVHHQDGWVELWAYVPRQGFRLIRQVQDGQVLTRVPQLGRKGMVVADADGNHVVTGQQGCGCHNAIKRFRPPTRGTTEWEALQL